MTEGELYPNATPTAEWGLTGAPTHHEAIDDDRGSVNVTDWIWAAGGSSGGTDILDFPNSIDDVDEITTIEVNLYHAVLDADENPAGSITVDINLGGWQGTKTLTKPHGAGWEAFTWTGLSGSQADLDGLQVRLISSGLGIGKYIPDSVQVYAMVVDITYTPTGPVSWGHIFLGVPAANIATVNGVPIANIASIKGVGI